MNATRVDNETLQCPTGTTPCSNATSPDNTLCYPPNELTSSCPITEIKFDFQKNLVSYQGDYKKMAISADRSVIFTKTMADSLPVI